MIEEGKAEDITFGESDADELVQMLMRFWRAAETGAARQNLELLSKVILGLKRNSTLEFDRFQTYANVLEALTRDEILAVGKIYNFSKSGKFQGNMVQRELEKSFDADKVHSLQAALTRTGLLIPVSAFGGLNYLPSKSLHELCELAGISRGIGA